MTKLSELSIADLKAAIDSMKEYQNERGMLIKEENPDIDLQSENGMREIGHAIFRLSRELHERIFKIPV